MKSNLTVRPIFWIVLFFTSFNVFADSGHGANPRYGHGEMYAAFQLGYGAGFTIGNSGRGDANDVTYLAMFPSFGIGISDPLSTDSWYSGNFDFVFEGEFLAFLGPGQGNSEGAAIKLRYNFLSLEKLVPFAEIGVGAGYITSNLNTQADGIAFYPQGGAGLNYFVSDNLALSLSYRYHHISNKGINKPNTGINANVGLLGVEYHFE